MTTMIKKENKEKGSLSLEHILFIGAVVAMSVGITAFYTNITTYFQGVGFAAAPTNVGGGAVGNGNN
jgi:uncharacterized protein (UPF0333 family)